jgi:hypothetical protein
VYIGVGKGCAFKLHLSSTKYKITRKATKANRLGIRILSSKKRIMAPYQTIVPSYIRTHFNRRELAFHEKQAQLIILEEKRAC